MGMKLSEKRIAFSELCTHLELFLLFEGVKYASDWTLRDVRTQTNLVNSGASQTMHSLHLKGLAKDYLLYDEMGSYIKDGDHPYYKMLGKRAKELGLVWGGDWTFNDAGHVEWSDA